MNLEWRRLSANQEVLFLNLLNRARKSRRNQTFDYREQFFKKIGNNHFFFGKTFNLFYFVSFQLRPTVGGALFTNGLLYSGMVQIKYVKIFSVPEKFLFPSFSFSFGNTIKLSFENKFFFYRGLVFNPTNEIEGRYDAENLHAEYIVSFF